MGGGDDEAAAAQGASRMMAVKRGLGGGVERGRRLVEQPERPVGDQEPGERDAPLSARRKAARAGKSIACARPSLRQRRAPSVARGFAAEHRAQKARFSPAVSAPFSASAWPR